MNRIGTGMLTLSLMAGALFGCPDRQPENAPSHAYCETYRTLQSEDGHAYQERVLRIPSGENYRTEIIYVRNEIATDLDLMISRIEDHAGELTPKQYADILKVYALDHHVSGEGRPFQERPFIKNMNEYDTLSSILGELYSRRILETRNADPWSEEE